MDSEEAPIKAMIFDLDGVLVNTNRLHLASLAYVFKKRGIEIPKKEIEHMFGEPAREIIRKLLEKEKITWFNAKAMLKEKRKFFKKAAVGQDLVRAETPLVLSILKRKAKLALVTGAGKGAMNIVFPKELQKNFKVVLTADDYKKGKPDPDAILKAAKKIKVKPKNCVYVGDSVVDIFAARNAKMRCIAFVSGIYSEGDMLKEKPWRLIKNLNELIPIISSFGEEPG